jgi:hypothetical protein
MMLLKIPNSAHDHHKNPENRNSAKGGAVHLTIIPGYQPPSLFFSRRETIKPRPKAHKPADSGAVVGNGARMCSLRECLEMSIK